MLSNKKKDFTSLKFFTTLDPLPMILQDNIKCLIMVQPWFSTYLSAGILNHDISDFNTPFIIFNSCASLNASSNYQNTYFPVKPIAVIEQPSQKAEATGSDSNRKLIATTFASFAFPVFVFCIAISGLVLVLRNEAEWEEKFEEMKQFEMFNGKFYQTKKIFRQPCNDQNKWKKIN